MTWFDYFINVMEAAVTAYIAVNFCTLKNERSKYRYLILFLFMQFSIVTAMNLIVGYEGLLYILLSVAQFLFIKLISTNTYIEVIIEVLLMGNLISLSNLCFLLPVYGLKGISFYSVAYGQNQMLSASYCFLTKVFLLFWGMMLVRFKKILGDVITNYNKIFLAIFLINYISILYLENLFFSEESMTNRYTISIYVLYFALNFVLLYFIYKSQRDYREKAEMQYLLEANRNVQQQLTQHAESNKRISKMKHDMLNEMKVVETYLEKGNINSALDEIKQKYNILKEERTMVYCGVAMIDSMINFKLIQAQEKGIDITVMAVPLKEGAIPEKDTALIIGYALDNAIDHNCLTDPFIDFTLSKKDGNLIVKVTNSTDLEFNESLKTTKNNPQQHGFGIKNIKYLINENHGKVEFKRKENVFICEIEIPLH